MAIKLLKPDYGPRGKGILRRQGPTDFLLDCDKGQFVISGATGIGKYVSKVVLDTEITYSLSAGYDQIRYIGPWNGVLVAQYKGMKLGENDTEPSPTYIPGGEAKTNRYGGTYTTKDKYVFTMLFHLLSPPFDGVESSKRFDYCFVLDGGVVALKGGRLAKQLWSALETMGMDMENTEIPPQPNVLPWLDQQLKSYGKQVQLVFEEGWINGINPMPIMVPQPVLQPTPPPVSVVSTPTTQALPVVQPQVAPTPQFRPPPVQPREEDDEIAKLRRRLTELEKGQPGVTLQTQPYDQVNPMPKTETLPQADFTPPVNNAVLTDAEREALKSQGLPGIDLDFSQGVPTEE